MHSLVALGAHESATMADPAAEVSASLVKLDSVQAVDVAMAVAEPACCGDHRSHREPLSSRLRPERENRVGGRSPPWRANTVVGCRDCGVGCRAWKSRAEALSKDGETCRHCTGLLGKTVIQPHPSGPDEHGRLIRPSRWQPFACQ